MSELVELPLKEISRPKQWPTLSRRELKDVGYPVYGANGRIGFAETYTHENPTIIIGCRGSCGTLHITEPKSYVTGNAMALDNLDLARVDQRYLFHFLAKRGFDDVVSGSSQPQITGKGLTRVKVPLPALKEQRRIAAILDKADAIRRKREQALALADDLLKSTFLEMFGDPLLNSHGYEEIPLGNIADITSGLTKGRRLKDDQIVEALSYMRVANVQDGFLDLSEIKEIEATPAEIEKYLLLNGDLLLTEGGDPDKLGRGCVWRDEITKCIHQNHIFRARLTDDRLLPEVLSRQISSRRGKVYFLREAKQTTGIATINKRQLSAYPVLIPPLSTQKEYMAVQAAVSEQFLGLLKGIDDAVELFGSLSQRAFQGEL